ncbi:hypothetical protein CFOL_v3_01867, partial [Cephalotus follicularis]
EMARTMLCENALPKYFWAEAVNNACYMLHRITIRPILKKTPYELWRQRKPNISYFRAFGCKCFVHNNGKDNLCKFDAKVDEGIFLGYSNSSKAYRNFNKKILVVEEFVHVIFDKSNVIIYSNIDDDDDEFLQEKVNDISLSDSPPLDDVVGTSSQSLDISIPQVRNRNLIRDHPIDAIIGNPSKGVTTRSSYNACNYLAFISQIERKNINEAENDEF